MFVSGVQVLLLCMKRNVVKVFRPITESTSFVKFAAVDHRVAIPFSLKPVELDLLAVELPFGDQCLHTEQQEGTMCFDN